MRQYTDKQRLLEFDLTKTQDLDYPDTMVCLSGDSYAFLMSLVSYFNVSMHWGDNWVDGKKLVERVLGELTMAACLRFNQNDCVLEVSYDGGLTYETMFNFGACISKGVQPIVDKLRSDLLQELRDKYDGTAGSISDNLVYDGTGDDDYRDLAMCLALSVMFKGIAELEREKRDQATEFWLNVGDTFEGVVLLALSFGLGGLPVVALAVTAAITQIAAGVASVFNEILDYVIYTDEYIQNLACCALVNLEGSTPTYSAFQNSLTGCGFFPDMVNLVTAYDAVLAELDVYLGFLDLMSTFYPLVKEGFLDTCPCNDDPWVKVFDLTDANDWELLERAIWVDGSGITNDPTPTEDILEIRIDTNPFFCYEMTFTFDVAPSHAPDTGHCEIYDYDKSNGTGSLPRNWLEYTHEFYEWRDGVRFEYNPSTGSDPTYQLGHLTTITVVGYGYNPFI